MTTITVDVRIGGGQPPSSGGRGKSYVLYAPRTVVNTAAGKTLVPVPDRAELDGNGTATLTLDALPAETPYVFQFTIDNGLWKSSEILALVPASGTHKLADLVVLGDEFTPPAWYSKVLTAQQVVEDAAAEIPDLVATAVTQDIAGRDLVETGDARLPQPVTPDPEVVRAFIDDLNRQLLAFLSDGSVRISDLKTLWFDAQEVTTDRFNGIEYAASLADVTGYSRVFVDSGDRVLLGLRPDGTWHIPFLETQAQLAPGTPTKVKSTYSAVEIPAVSGPAVVLAGHSMLAGAAGAITSALNGITTVTSLCVGGETSRTINARFGGQPATFLPAGGTIPASGSVDVTIAWADGAIAAGWPLLQGPTSYTGYLVLPDGTKVAGTFGIIRDPAATPLYHHAGDRYTFTRAATGSAITLNRPAPFYYDVAIARRDDIAVYWLGRNNISETDQILGDLASMIQRQRPLHDRFLVLSEHNSATETSGTSGWTSVMAYNTKARQTYGRRFIDTRQYLIDYGLTDAGITPTAQDTADIAAGVVPLSLRGDNLHLNPAGSAVVAQLIRRRLLELEWTAA